MFTTASIQSKTAIYRNRHSTALEFVDKQIDLVPKGNGFGVKSQEILIKTAAASFNPLDAIYKTVAFTLFGLRGPFEMGFDYSGEIVDIGEEMAAKYHVKIGDKVCGQTSAAGYKNTMTEYLLFELPNDKNFSVIKVPSNLTMVEAASFPLVYSTAFQMVEKSRFGEAPAKVLVCGASTSVGKYLVSLLKLDPRVDEIVGICSKKSEPLVKELGVDSVIDYGATDNLFETVMDHCRDRKFQCYYDCTGNEALVGKLSNFIEKGGSCVSIAGGKKYELSDGLIATRYLNWSFIKNIMSSYWGLSSVDNVWAKVEAGDGFEDVEQLFESGKIKPFVHSVYEFEDIQSAFDLLVSGKNNGKIVVEMKN